VQVAFLLRRERLETICESAQERLIASGAPVGLRAAQARHFARREADIMAFWDSSR